MVGGLFGPASPAQHWRIGRVSFFVLSRGVELGCEAVSFLFFSVLVFFIKIKSESPFLPLFFLFWQSSILLSTLRFSLVWPSTVRLNCAIALGPNQWARLLVRIVGNEGVAPELIPTLDTLILFFTRIRPGLIPQGQSTLSSK